MKFIHIWLPCFLALTCVFMPPRAVAGLPDPETMQSWVRDMKASPRGPFARIRWFCNDGTVLPPKPYACADHGGGRQHGEWSDKTRQR